MKLECVKVVKLISTVRHFLDSRVPKIVNAVFVSLVHNDIASLLFRCKRSYFTTRPQRAFTIGVFFARKATKSWPMLRYKNTHCSRTLYVKLPSVYQIDMKFDYDHVDHEQTNIQGHND